MTRSGLIIASPRSTVFSHMSESTPPPGPDRRHARLRPGIRLLVAAILTVIAAVPRFHDLGELSLYADEDYTAVSARSVLEGEGSRLPSGMSYRRALPLTWLNAGVASVLGTENEASYRVTAAAFGAATPAAVFLIGPAFVSPPAALTAATFLAVSEWHIAMSRYGRMYTAFLFLFLLTAYFAWRFAREGGWVHGVLAALFFGATVSVHLLGLLAVQFAVIPLFLPGGAAVSPWLLLTLVPALAAGVHFLSQELIHAPYGDYTLPPGFDLGGGGPPGSRPDAGHPLWLPGALGAVLGFWLGWRLSRGLWERGDRLRAVAIVGASVLTGALIGAGHLWGAALVGAAGWLIHPEGAGDLLRRGGAPLGALALGAGAWCAYALFTLGPSDGVRRLASFPFPYLALLWFQFPGLVALFGGAVGWLILVPSDRRPPGVVGSALAVLLTMGALGTVSAWGGTRYLFQIYPFIVFCAAAFLVLVAERLLARFGPGWGSGPVAGLGVVVALSGLTGGHGIAPAYEVATLEHGEPVNEYTHIVPFRPDHRSPGLYVRRHLAEGDIVIAEDPIVQQVYAGQVDYWLRSPWDARAFLYLGPGGRPRDMYIGSLLLPNADEIEAAVDSAEGRAWLITSGETASRPEWYLSRSQRAWFDSVKAVRSPAFVGEDGHTRAFCLNCEGPPEPAGEDPAP